MTLLLSKLQSENIVVKKENYFVDEQIEEYAMLFYNETQEKNINIKFDLDHIKINASKELMQEIWINLLNNAIKYSKENGHILIRSYETTNDFAFVFQDDGIGMNSKTLNHIFDEYYQGNDSRMNNGIGLGLSIVKKILELHNFKLEVSSKENIGSNFTIFITKIK